LAILSTTTVSDLAEECFVLLWLVILLNTSVWGDVDVVVVDHYCLMFECRVICAVSNCCRLLFNFALGENRRYYVNSMSHKVLSVGESSN